MSIKPSDILFYGGGAALARFGTLSRRTNVVARRGEGVIETFARTGVGKMVDGGGTLISAAANLPRLNQWADGAILSTPRLLLEDARENVCLQSEDFGTTWATSGSSISTNADTAPDGTATADRLVEDAGNNTHVVLQTSMTVTDEAELAFSCFLKQGDSEDWMVLDVESTAAPQGERFRAWFDVANGVVGSNAEAGTGVFSRAYIEEFPGGWYRCTIVGTLGSTITDATVHVYLDDADGGNLVYQGDGSSYNILWGAQLEDEVDFLSSYIKTAAAAVTRNAESLSFPFPAPPQEMTMFAKFVERGTILKSGNPRQLHIGSTVSADPRFSIFVDTYYGIVHDDGITPVSKLLAAAPSVGDSVELLASLSSAGAVQITQSINGAATTNTTVSADITLASAWASPAIWLNGVSNGNRGFVENEAAIVARGTHSLADFRALLP